MLRCAELNLHTDDLEQFTVGMIYDLLIEKANDQEKYEIKGKGMKQFFERGGKLGER